MIEDKRPMDKDGLPHGKWVAYHNNGNKILEKTYVHGVMQGQLIKYHTNGKLWTKSNRVNDKLHGEAVGYDIRGTITYIENYKHGIMSGRCQYFWDGIKRLDKYYIR